MDCAEFRHQSKRNAADVKQLQNCSFLTFETEKNVVASNWPSKDLCNNYSAIENANWKREKSFEENNMLLYSDECISHPQSPISLSVGSKCSTVRQLTEFLTKIAWSVGASTRNFPRTVVQQKH